MTKLQRPALKRRMLLRKALIKQLYAADGYPFVLISGPAGSGKTSLACQWIKQEKLAAAWYSLDEEDNEPDLFFRYLLTTLAQTDERLKKAFCPILANQWELSGTDLIPHLIAALSTLSRDIHLVLDDFHQISNEKIHAALARLIRYLPANLYLIILSRYCLPAPLDAVILKKERFELSASDLKFTEKETADLYKEIIPLSLSPDQIRDLNRHVEGWAAGLQLIGLSVEFKRRSTDLSDILNQAHEQVANYLIQDILRKQPSKIREFIFATALLDRFNPELCAQVGHHRDPAEVLARLERMNLFLIPLDARRKWYRYHHIFSEVVRREVAAIDPDAVPATLRKAALWFAQNNHLEEALGCAFRSDDPEFTADLLEDYILGYMDTFDLAAGLRWIQKLPESLLNQRPLLRLQQCAFFSILMEFSEVKETLAAFEKNGSSDVARYPDAKRTLCRDYTAYLRCLLHILYAGKTAAVDQIEALRDKLPPRNPLLVGAIEMQIVFILISKGELSKAESFLARLAATPLAGASRLMLKKIYHAKAKALIAGHHGRLNQAETIILQVVTALRRQGCDNSPMAFLLHRHLGTIYYLQNRLDKARECAVKMKKYRECEYFGLIDEILTGSELQLRLHRAAGEYEQATQCIQQIQAYSIRLGMPRIAAGADACAARLAVDQGNLAPAEVWSRRRRLRTDETFSLLFAMECITQARLDYAQKRYAQAAEFLAPLRRRCLKRSLGESALKIDILLAAVFHAMNQPEKAVVSLKKALTFAEAEGYVRPFVNDSKMIAPILRNIAAQAPAALSPAYLKKVFTACDIAFSRPRVSSGLPSYEHEDLTQREIEVLTWIAQGFQNKEIAQRGCIAITTVKSHVSNILVKLDVKTRTQAVLKAKEIRILTTV